MVAASTPVDIAVNPNNSDQRYVLWKNGRISAEGGAVPTTDHQTWYDRFEGPAVAIHIANWTTGAGYTLDYRGGIHPFNGAPALGTGSTPELAPGIPLSASPRTRLYVDWSWDPSGSGQFYVLDLWGKLLNGGGATPPPRTGPRFPSARARRLAMRWSPSKMAITMDMHGRMYGDFASFTMPARPSTLGAVRNDIARDFVVTSWTAPPSGHILDLQGGLHEFGSAANSFGFPYKAGADVARVLAVLSASDPMRFLEVWSGGQHFEWVSSTAPTVVAGGSDPVSPATTVTDTTRPELLWDYSDAQGDSQSAWQLYVYTQAWATGHSMTNPAVWSANALVAREGINRTTRGITSPVDLPNGTYRMYVRAKDSSGKWSAWANRGWTQNVPVPVTPTGLTATANQSTFRVALSVSATTGGSANLIRFEYSDNGGTTWQPVRGAGAVTLTSTTTATDYDAPFGVTRTYRAVAYAIDPAVASVPSSTATATLASYTYTLHVTEDPTLGGEVHVTDTVDWERPVSSGVFQGLGADFATVVSDGQPKSRRTTVHLNTTDRPAYERVKNLVEADSTLVYRDPFGEVIYCRLTDSWNWTQLPAAPLPGEVTPLRHAHSMRLPMVEVAPPVSDL